MSSAGAGWFVPLEQALKLAAEYQSKAMVHAVTMTRQPNGAVEVIVTTSLDENSSVVRYRYDTAKGELVRQPN